MPEILTLFLAGTATALATGIRAIPVFGLGAERAAALRPALWGLAAGLMGMAPSWDCSCRRSTRATPVMW
jgi:hypothetical protein